MPTPFDPTTIRGDFPLLERARAEPFVYLDSAATSLKPRPVIEALAAFQATSGGSVGRGVYRLARETTARYQEARRRIADFIGGEEEEIVFVRNATEAINLVAAGHPEARRGQVLTTWANHHSGLLPWRRPAAPEPVRLEDDGTLALEDLERKLAARPALLCLPHVSNALGLELPVEQALRLARRHGTLVLLDGAQSVPHLPIDVGRLGCDFLVWSGHKMLAPEGIGVLWAKREHLEAMEPCLLGGDMVASVRGDSFELKEPPGRFEAGTPNVGGAVALAAAAEYLEQIGLARIHEHVRGLAVRARHRLRQIEGLSLYGPASDAAVTSAVSFGFAGMAAHALALMLSNRFGIMVRSGYLCAQPFHEMLGWPETVRASFYLYNTVEEVEALATALETVRETLLS